MKSILAVLLLGFSGCATLCGVPEHTHKGELDVPCEIQCGAGDCASAYDVDAQARVDCKDPTGDLCVCTAPED